MSTNVMTNAKYVARQTGIDIKTSPVAFLLLALEQTIRRINQLEEQLTTLAAASTNRGTEIPYVRK